MGDGAAGVRGAANVQGATSARGTAPGRTVDPYRILFPLGVAGAVAGALLWPLHAAGLVLYPAVAHWTLMIQGFQHAFMLGFLMTSMPAWMHSTPARPWELTIASTAVLGILVSSLFAAAPPGPGAASLAIILVQLFYAATLILLVTMALRRVRKSTAPPPEEFLLVAFGLLVGLAGAAATAAQAAGVWIEPAPRFGLRMIWMGMLLPVVLGVGGLLVPTFTSMKGPLVIPGIAKPHARPPRRALYSLIALAMLAALGLEAAGRGPAGALVRAVAGSVVLLLVWKVYRLPGRKDLLSFFLWTSGWMILAGLWLMVVAPGIPLLGAHTIFLGGFGALTAGIATRVVVRHGSYPLVEEGQVLRPAMAVLAAAAILARLLAELMPGARLWLLAVSGSSWVLAWLTWGAGAAPRLLRRYGAPVDVTLPSPRGVVPRASPE